MSPPVPLSVCIWAKILSLEPISDSCNQGEDQKLAAQKERHQIWLEKLPDSIRVSGEEGVSGEE